MTLWDKLREKHSWGTSLFLKSGVLGLGIVVVLWAGWPQPQFANLDHSAVPNRLSESTTIQEVPNELRPVNSVSRRETSQPSTEEGKGLNLQPTNVLPLLVDLNVSSQMELQTLPGIGIVLADRIVSYRSTYGEFQRVGDLVNVSGIGEKRLKRLEPLVTVQEAVREIGG